jgi:hypothetical protein
MWERTNLRRRLTKSRPAKSFPAVLLLPRPDEVRVANQYNAKIGWEGIITAVNFRVKGALALIGKDGRKVPRQATRGSSR